MKKLVIAEKYNVAKDYADALGASRRDGYFECEEYCIAWVSGHIYKLKNPEEYDQKYRKWEIRDLPIVPPSMQIVLDHGSKNLHETIKYLAHRSDIGSIIIGTDAGREGELIGRYVLAGVKNTKPVYRVWIRDRNAAAIKKTFTNLVSIENYDNLYAAARARAECDWLLGINMTRAYTLYEGYGKTLHIGRCQTPILALIYNRDVEIASFESTRFFELVSVFDYENGVYTGKWFDRSTGSSIINLKSDAERLKHQVSNQKGTVAAVDKEIKKIPHPLLHNQTTLQIAMNKKYGFSAQKTLDIAQKLYDEYKVLSYPRTSSQFLTSNMVNELPGLISNLNFGPFADIVEQIGTEGKIKVTNRLINDEGVTDHTALIPVENKRTSSIYSTLGIDEKRVLDEVIYSFLACFFNEYIYESITVITDIKGELFKSQGNKKLQMGWRNIYSEEIEQDEILQLKENQEVTAASCEVVEKKTIPPAHYTEGSLLEVMKNPRGHVEDKTLKKVIQEKGIGTDATRAKLINDLIDRGYVRREGKDGKYLVTTAQGRDLVNIIENELLKSVELTADWEYKLEKIAAGEISKDEFMKDVIKFLIRSIEEIKEYY